MSAPTRGLKRLPNFCVIARSEATWRSERAARGSTLGVQSPSKKHVIARSAATWQSPGTIHRGAQQYLSSYREIATPLRARNDISRRNPAALSSSFVILSMLQNDILFDTFSELRSKSDNSFFPGAKVYKIFMKIPQIPLAFLKLFRYYIAVSTPRPRVLTKNL